jgi:hypothetical protein
MSETSLIVGKCYRIYIACIDLVSFFLLYCELMILLIMIM